MESNLDGEWDKVIRSSGGKFSLNLAELWKYRDLIFLFIKRDFIANYKQTVLGPLWHLLQPLITTFTFVIIFGKIAKLSTDGTPSILFYMIGIVSWSYFSACLIKTSTTFLSNAHIFSKVYFPRLTVPISIVISNFITFFVQLILYVSIYAYFVLSGKYSLEVNFYYLLLFPLLILIMAMLGLGLGIIVSSLTTKYKDFSFLVGFGTQILMYLSPVIFPLSSVEGNLRVLLLFNPMTPVIETMRAISLGQGVVEFYHLMYSFVFSMIVLLVGIFLFNRIEKSFNDTI